MSGRNFGWLQTDWFDVQEVLFNSNRLVWYEEEIVWSKDKSLGCLQTDWFERKLWYQKRKKKIK